MNYDLPVFAVIGSTPTFVWAWCTVTPEADLLVLRAMDRSVAAQVGGMPVQSLARQLLLELHARYGRD